MSLEGDFVQIYQDNREPDYIYNHLKELYKVKLEQLECFDYIISGVGLERKTPTDLWNSIKGRIWDQLYAMKQYCEANNTRGFVVMVGSPMEILKYINGAYVNTVRSSLTGFALTSSMSFGIPLLRLDTEDDFYRLIDVLVKRNTSDKTSYKPVDSRGKDKKKVVEIKSDILTCLPGWGRAISDDIAGKYSIVNLANMPDEDLINMKVNGRKIGNKALNVKKYLTE